MLEAVIESLIDQGISTEQKAKTFLQYYRSNRSGIRIWYSEPESGRSCAEGLVSHILSNRLSSRAKAWGNKGLESVTRLRAYILNGGTITADDLKRSKSSTETQHYTGETKKKAELYVSEFMPDVRNALKSAKAGTATYRLFDTIKNGGYLF